MTEVCISIYRFFRKHRAIYWTSMMAIFVFLGYFAFCIHLEEDINKLMPSSKNEDGTTKLAFADLRIKDKTFLLFSLPDGWKGDKEEGTAMLTEACDAFIDSLQARDTTSIADIFYQLPEETIPEAVSYLIEHLPAYIDTSVYASMDTLFTVEHMTRQMEQNREDLLGPVGESMPELIQIDPIGMRNLLAAKMQSMQNSGISSYQMIDGHFFVPDSTVCLAFITPLYSSTNTGQGSALFFKLNQLIEEFSTAYPDVHIGYYGAPAEGFYNSTTIKKDLVATITGSLILVLIFIMVCFRNWDTIPLLILPVAFGTFFGLAIMYFLKDQFSLLALAIGAIVLGVALSYVLHVLTHFKYVNDPEQVLREQVKPVLLGCVTTIGSFMGLIFIKTDLLRDFGLFATFAIMGTVFFCLVYLPQMFRPAHNKINHKAFALIDRINAYPFDRKRPLLATLLLLIVVCVGAYIVKGTQFDADMKNLGYKEKTVLAANRLFSEKTKSTGSESKYFASSGTTMEEAIEHFSLLSQKLDSLQEVGLVKSYTKTNVIFVPLKQQQERIDAWQAYWTEERLAKVRSLIAQTAPKADLSPEGFEPFFELATAQCEPEPLYEAEVIPQGFQSTLMEQSYGGEYLCFTSVRFANDDSTGSSDSDYMRICDAIAKEPHLLVLDTYYYTTETLRQLNSDFNVLQWISMLFVFMVLLLSYRYRSAAGSLLWGRNLKLALLSFAPIVLSWLIVLGAMNIFGMRFNLINIIISTFIFGIGVDYSIFVMSGLTSNNHQLNYHKTAIFFSAFILIVTVGSMLLARHPAIHSVGFATLVGMIAAVVLSYVLQPAIYRWMQKEGKDK
jgi:predicted exporter